MERILQFWDGRSSSEGETITKQRWGNRKLQGLSKQTDCLQTRGYVWESRGHRDWQCYQKPGTSGWVHVRYSESVRVKMCISKTWKQALSNKKAADKPKPKNGWEREGKLTTKCLEMCAHSGRLSMGRKESRHTTKGRTERKQPGILDITENCLHILPLFNFSTLLSLHTYLSQNELYCRESLRSDWGNLSNAPFETRVFRPRFSSLPKSLLFRAWLVRAPSAARTGKGSQKLDYQASSQPAESEGAPWHDWQTFVCTLKRCPV